MLPSMGATVIAASCRLASLRLDGWVVSPQEVERNWRQERLKLAQKQPQRGGLWLALWALCQSLALRAEAGPVL